MGGAVRPRPYPLKGDAMIDATGTVHTLVISVVGDVRAYGRCLGCSWQAHTHKGTPHIERMFDTYHTAAYGKDGDPFAGLCV